MTCRPAASRSAGSSPGVRSIGAPISRPTSSSPPAAAPRRSRCVCARVAKPGDVVAVESPTYFGVLQAIEEQRLRALEIPMHPRDGMDLDALERAVKSRRIAACLATPNFNNPLGSLMPDANKQRLVEILAKREVPLIEDDINGSLAHGGHRPRVAQSYDKAGLVLLCGSISKTIAPGYRVGWVAPGRFYEKVKALKITSTLATASLPPTCDRRAHRQWRIRSSPARVAPEFRGADSRDARSGVGRLSAGDQAQRAQAADSCSGSSCRRRSSRSSCMSARWPRKSASPPAPCFPRNKTSRTSSGSTAATPGPAAWSKPWARSAGLSGGWKQLYRREIVRSVSGVASRRR